MKLRILPLALIMGMVFLNACSEKEPKQTDAEGPPVEQEAAVTDEIRLDFSGKGTVWRFNEEIQQRFPKDRGCFVFGREGEGWKLEAMGENDFVDLAAGAWSELEVRQMGMGALVGKSLEDGAWEMRLDGKEEGEPYRLEAEDPGRHIFLRSGKWLLCAKPTPPINIAMEEFGSLDITSETGEINIKVGPGTDSAAFRLVAWEGKNGATGAAILDWEPGSSSSILDKIHSPLTIKYDFPENDIQKAVENLRREWKKQMAEVKLEKTAWVEGDPSGDLFNEPIGPEGMQYWSSEKKFTWGDKVAYLEEGKFLRLDMRPNGLQITEIILKN